MTTAFTALPGMFTTAKVGNSGFAPGLTPATAPAKTARVTMAVDAFQRRFQSFGKINIDYSRPKKLASYKRSGAAAAMIDYPNTPTFAGKYSISNCGKASGASAIMMKYDEYCAKGMMQVYKRSACPTGVYSTKCAEATTPYGAAEEKRVFSRQTAFRQAQKPINVRLNEMYEARKAAFVMAHGCDREEKQFSVMPMVSCRRLIVTAACAVSANTRAKCSWRVVHAEAKCGLECLHHRSLADSCRESFHVVDNSRFLRDVG